MKVFLLQLVFLAFCYNYEYKLDLDKSNRSISDYLKNISILSDYNPYSQELFFLGTNEAQVNSSLTLSFPRSKLSNNIPELTISEHTQNTNYNYSLKVNNCTDCLLFDYAPEIKGDYNISCSYDNGRFSHGYNDNLTSALNDRSNWIWGPYNVRHTAKGNVEMSQLSDTVFDSHDLNEYTKAYYPLEGKNIFQIFLFHNYLNVFVENDLLILYTSQNINLHIVIDVSHLDRSKEFRSVFTDPRNNRTYIFCKDGFYDIKKVNETTKYVFIDTIDSNSAEPIKLNDIQAYAQINNRTFCALITVKNKGFLWIDLSNNYTKINFLKHDYITGLQRSQTTSLSVVSLGVTVNNTDPNVGEFFIEFTLDLNLYNSLSISRVFIASTYISIIKTAYDSVLSLFLADKRLYLVPRNVYERKNIPVYFIDLKDDYNDFIPYANIACDIMLNLHGTKNNTLVINTFQSYYSCIFKNGGEYDFKIGRINKGLNERIYEYNVKIDSVDNDFPVTYIILLVIGAIALVVAIIWLILYFMKRQRTVLNNQYSIHN
jgi:hypothetical protein